MGTDNRRVAAYLPPSIDEKFIEFKIERGLATKENPKTSDSKALILILQEYFGVSQEVARPVAHYVTIEQFDFLQAKVEDLYRLLQKSEARLEEAVSEAKSELKSELQSESNLKVSPGQLNLLSQASSTKDQGFDSSGSLLSELPSELLSGLSAVKLSRRLKCDRKKIARMRNSESFAEWCRDQDPDGIPWRYQESDKKYYPVKP